MQVVRRSGAATALIWRVGIAITLAAMAVIAQNTNAIDWTLAPTTDTFPAVSTYNPTNVNLGTCICDLTQNYCDANCKCDPLCLQSEINHFSFYLAESQSNYSINTCNNADWVEVNARGGLTSTALGNLLCVADDNNPSKGTFYDPPTTDAAALAVEFDTRRLQVPFTLQPNLNTALNHPTGVNEYATGDALLAIRTNSAGVVYGARGNRLVVPGPGPGGVCSESYSAQFETTVQPRRCLRVVDDLMAACTATRGTLSALPYTVGISIAQSYSTFPSTGIPLWVTSLQLSDSSFVTLPAGNASSPFLGPMPEPSYNSTGGCSCNNVLKSLTYTIKRDFSGQVTEAYATVTLGVVTGIVNAANKCQASVEQTYAVNWNATQSQGLVVARSGNPGYLYSRPVLFGTLETLVVGAVTRQAVSQWTDGLWGLLSDNSGFCRSTVGAAPTSSGLHAERVNFGENMHTSCLVPLDLAGLQAKCLIGVWDLWNISTTATFGTYGNAMFYQPWMWTSLIQQTQPIIPPSNFDAVKNQCSFPNIFNLEILYAPTGQVGNEQYKILTARLNYASATWTYQHEAEVSTTIEYFPVTMTVTWVPATGQYEEYVPGPPNPFPKLPADILYPFYIPSAAHPTTAAPHVLVVAVSIAAAVFVAAIASVRND